MYGCVYKKKGWLQFINYYTNTRTLTLNYHALKYPPIYSYAGIRIQSKTTGRRGGKRNIHTHTYKHNSNIQTHTLALWTILSLTSHNEIDNYKSTIKNKRNKNKNNKRFYFIFLFVSPFCLIFCVPVCLSVCPGRLLSQQLLLIIATLLSTTTSSLSTTTKTLTNEYLILQR